MPNEKDRFGKLDKRDREIVRWVSEMLAYQNNQLLGFLAKTLAPTGASLENFEVPLNEELLEELCKLHAENSIWGET